MILVLLGCQRFAYIETYKSSKIKILNLKYDKFLLLYFSVLSNFKFREILTKSSRFLHSLSL
jgi:hypothetical protein